MKLDNTTCSPLRPVQASCRSRHNELWSPRMCACLRPCVSVNAKTQMDQLNETVPCLRNDSRETIVYTHTHPQTHLVYEVVNKGRGHYAFLQTASSNSLFDLEILRKAFVQETRLAPFSDFSRVTQTGIISFSYVLHSTLISRIASVL